MTDTETKTRNTYVQANVGKGSFHGTPLVIVGPGPSYDWLPKETYADHHVFALNCAITDLWPTHRSALYWVSNDHDRTWMSGAIKKEVPRRVAGWKPWNTITNRKFIPGPVGDINWTDHKGRVQPPMDWRLPLPDGSTVWWYEESDKERPGYMRNGHSCLELALEVATLWGYGPIVLVGCDMGFQNEAGYYAEPFRYKPIPPRVGRHKMKPQRDSIVVNRLRWAAAVSTIATPWEGSLFEPIEPREVAAVLAGTAGLAI